MPGMRCTVATCNNSREKDGDRVTFHRFPQDKKIRREWVIKCKRGGRWNPDTCHVCSEHFKTTDYVENSKKKKLKPDAVPTLNILPEKVTPCAESRRNRMEAKRKREVVQQVLKESENRSEPGDSGNVLSSHPEILLETRCQPSDSGTIFSSHHETLPENFSEKESFMQLSKKYQELLKMSEQWKLDSIKSAETVQQLKKKLRASTLANKKLEKEINDIKRTDKKYLNAIIEEKLRPTLTKNQLRVILEDQKRVVWDVEDLKRAITVRYFNKRCFIYLKNILKYPLPGLSTVHRYISKIDLGPGILDDMILFLGMAGSSFKDTEKLVILQYDEVKVSSVYEYDQKRDQVVGPHSYMQVIMARGIFSDWKQPVAIFFDQKITKNIIDSVTEKLMNIGFTTVACVSDCGGGNVGLWKALDVSYEKPFYLSEITKGKIYFFADVPHLLKLTRNWFLDTGFTIMKENEDEDVLDLIPVNKEPVKAIMEMLPESDVSSMYYLTEKHLYVSKTERQNVQMATELLSHTTATGLRRYLPGDPLAENTADFIDLINSWFDVMNSYNLKASQDLQKPFGIKLEEQKRILNDTYKVVKNMLCCGKTCLQIFQKGILMSINSLLGLFDDLQEKYGITFILTHKLNQDSLENLFSQIRTRGGLYDHPSPLSALHRLRMILLGKNPGIIQARLNVIDKLESNFVTERVISKAGLNTDQKNEKAPMAPERKVTVEGEENNNITSLSLDNCPDQANKSESLKRKSIIESDGEEYLAGWLVRKFKKKYPFLGDFTYKSNTEHDYAPSWVQMLSYGGLCKPSFQLMQAIEIFQKLYHEHHGQEGFRAERNMTEKLARKIFKLTEANFDPKIPYDVVYAFVKIKTFIRIRHLNKKIKLDGFLKKRKAEEDISRKLSKKYKRIVT